MLHEDEWSGAVDLGLGRVRIGGEVLGGVDAVPGDAKWSSIDAFTAFILKMTVLASGVSMVPTSAKVAWRVDTTPAGGLRMRS